VLKKRNIYHPLLDIAALFAVGDGTHSLLVWMPADNHALLFRKAPRGDAFGNFNYEANDKTLR